MRCRRPYSSLPRTSQSDHREQVAKPSPTHTCVCSRVMPSQVQVKQSSIRQQRDAPWGGVPRQSDAMRNFRNPIMESARDRCLQSKRFTAMSGPAGKGDLLTRASRGLSGRVGDNPRFARGTGSAPAAPAPASSHPSSAGRFGLPECKMERATQRGKRFPKGHVMTQQFFSPGHASVSDNGKNNAECFFRHARPWAGQWAISYPSVTSLAGTRYNWPPERD